MMNQFIKRLKVTGLHGRFDLDVEFSDDVNIVHGVNGAGKTTMLHILASAANLDLERFQALIFRSIVVQLANGPDIEILSEPFQSNGRRRRVMLHIGDEDVVQWPLRSRPADQEEPALEILTRRLSECREARGITVNATYFPAFRTMSEAWSSLDLSEALHSGMLRRMVPSARYRAGLSSRFRRDVDPALAEYEAQTALARGIFGQFVPAIKYPSPREIQRELDGEIQRAVNRLAGEDRSLLSDAFHKVFEAISHEETLEHEDLRTPDAIRTSISKQLNQLQSIQGEYGLSDNNSTFDALRSQLDSSGILAQEGDVTTTRVLRIYERALNEREDNLSSAFSTVREYINAVNHFLEGKQLVTAPADERDSTPRLQIRHSDGTLSSLDTLSSGERQVAGLIYSASRMAEGNVILVDEPELSLHIDWQRMIIGAMVKQLPSKQLIVCTHSPVIGAGYEDEMKELVPKPTQSVNDEVSELYLDESDWTSFAVSEELE